MRIEPRRRLAASACLLFGASLLAAYAGVSSHADERVPPRNAHASRYGGGWECFLDRLKQLWGRRTNPSPVIV